MISIAPAQRLARGLLFGQRMPGRGIEFAVISTCGLVKIGVELLRSKLRGGDVKPHIIFGRCLTVVGPNRTDLDALRHHAGVEQGVDALLIIGQDDDVSLNADNVKITLVTSVGLLCDVPD